MYIYVCVCVCVGVNTNRYMLISINFYVTLTRLRKVTGACRPRMSKPHSGSDRALSILDTVLLEIGSEYPGDLLAFPETH